MQTKDQYIEGNTVRKINNVPSHQYTEENMFIRNRQVSQAKKKRLRKAKAENVKYYLFVTLVFAGLIVLSIRYLTLNNSFSTYKNQVVAKEIQLQQLTEQNAILATKLCAPLDLLDIKRVAIEEFGMVEASKDQVKFYVDSNESYVKQYSDIPEHEKTAINVVGFITFGR